MMAGLCPPLQLLPDVFVGGWEYRHTHTVTNTWNSVCGALSRNRVFPALVWGLSNAGLQALHQPTKEKALHRFSSSGSQSLQSQTHPELSNPLSCLAQERHACWCWEGSTSRLCTGSHWPRIPSLLCVCKSSL